MNRHERRARQVLQRRQFPHIRIGASVVYIDRSGDGANTPHEMRVIAHCTICGCAAIVPLPPPLLAEQPDETTHVCLPQIGGCNTGFTYEGPPVEGLIVENPEESEGPKSEG